MGKGTSTLLLILLATKMRMKMLAVNSILLKSPDKRHSPCHNLLPLFLGGLPHNFSSRLPSLKAFVAPNMLGIVN